MPSRPKNISAEDKEYILDFSRRISSAIDSYCRQQGIQICQLSKDMGYDASSLSNMIRSYRANSKWSTDMLFMVARTLSIPLSRIIKSAETGVPLSPEAVPLEERIAALEKELAFLRKKRELYAQLDALKIEAEHLGMERDTFSV